MRPTTTIVLMLTLIMFSLVACKKSTPPEDEPTVIVQNPNTYAHTKFVMGADLSYLNAIGEYGGIFKSENVAKDPMTIFQEAGTNLVRVRLWHTPSWQKDLYGGIKYSQLADVTKTIQRAKDKGMAVNLDIHYSDDWADPAKQETPAAWKNAPLSVLKDSVYNYTLAVLNHLKLKNLVPEYIQVGNENNSGILHPIGKISSNQYGNFATLINSGIKAVRDFSATSSIKPLIIVHVAQLQNATWWTDGIIKAGIIDYDILGISHYAKWSNVKTMAEISTQIAALKAKTQKEVMIVETAYPWTNNSKDGYPNIISNSDALSGYPATPDGQLLYMKDLTQAIINGGGKGIMYWEPAWISTPTFKDRWGTGSSWENNAFFDFDGKILPVMGYMTHKYTF